MKGDSLCGCLLACRAKDTSHHVAEEYALLCLARNAKSTVLGLVQYVQEQTSMQCSWQQNLSDETFAQNGIFPVTKV